ncbi:MAG TPA: hypothetical protein VMX16_11170 [Terriglobia bacterium]|nr:hypothetical protein [Terriglobia bacterium]
MSALRRGCDHLKMDGSSDSRRNMASFRSSAGGPAGFHWFSIAIVSLACLFLLPPIGAEAQESPGGASLSYTKVLKGSIPEYEKVTVNADGAGQYDGRKLTDAPDPRPFKLTPAVVSKLFDLAASLEDFQNVDLESHKRVANLGRKTFVYRKGAEQFQCVFNYTLNRKARELTNLFEGLAAVENHLATLEYSMKYDHLGLPRDLTEIQADLDQGALTDPALLAPDLKEIIQDSRYLHIAQVRAQRILDQIQD